MDALKGGDESSRNITNSIWLMSITPKSEPGNGTSDIIGMRSYYKHTSSAEFSGKRNHYTDI